MYESTSDVTTSFFVNADSHGCNSRRTLLDENDLNFDVDIGPIDLDVGEFTMTTTDCTNGRKVSLDASLLFIQNPDGSWTVDIPISQEQSTSAPGETAGSEAADSASAFDDLEATTVSLGRCRAGLTLESGEGCDYGSPDPNSTTFYVEHNGVGCKTERTTNEEVDVDLGIVDIDIDSFTMETSSCTTDRTVSLGNSLTVRKNSDRSWTVDTHTTRDTIVTDPINSTTAALPGEGVDVTAGRANWSSGYFQAELYKQILEELGYNVSDPAEIELAPNNGYIAMARGEMDFWPNSWYPGHLARLADELLDGSLVGDHVTIVGEEMLAGGLQGFLVTKSFADEYGVYTMDELNSNADALAAFDATDSNPGNGVADIFGCPEVWACDNIIESMIAFSGWDNIAQITAGYDAMFAQAVDSVGEGVPMVLYTWTPSDYITLIRPGDNVYWMGVDDILDDSNPASQVGGQQYDQRGADGSGGYASIGPDQCPSAADQDSGKCKIGWLAADILVTANNDFLAANPAAEALFEAVRLSVIDVSLANVAMGQGESPADLATQWIADNRGMADAWISAALSPSTADTHTTRDTIVTDPTSSTNDDTTTTTPTTSTKTTSTTTVPLGVSDLFMVEITQCEGQVWAVSSLVTIHLYGTITAKRAIDTVTMWIDIDGTANGQSLTGAPISKTVWSVGESEDFHLFGTIQVDPTDTTLSCGIDVALEARGLSQ